MQKVNAHSLDKALSAVLEDEQCISVTIATAHEETCDYTREKVAPLLEAARSRPVYAQCPPSMVSIALFLFHLLLLFTSALEQYSLLRAPFTVCYF